MQKNAVALLMSTKYYPVNMQTGVILDVPFDKVKDLNYAYKGQQLLAVRGLELLTGGLYQNFLVQPEYDKAKVLASWLEESKGRYLWGSAARQILAILQEKGLSEALALITEADPGKQMSIHAYYARAKSEIRYLLKWERYPQGVMLSQA